MSRSTEGAESLFLRELFERMNANSLHYSVLRNYECLPEGTGGSDLDIAVLHSDRERIASVVRTAALKYGGETIVDYEVSGHFLRILGVSNHEWWGVAIDLFDSIEYRGVEYVSCEKIINRSKSHGAIRVADDGDALIVALVKELLSNGRSRKGYLEDASTLWQQRGKECLDVLSESIDSNTLECLGKTLESSGGSLEDLVTSLRKAVLSKGSTWHRAYNLWKRFRRLWKTPGVAVAVLGTDGAGKTTVIAAIKPTVEQALHSRIEYEHLRPNWIPRLGRVAGKSEPIEKIDNPHAQKPSGFLGSVARLIYYAVDYYVGYWRKVHLRLAKGPCLVLFDRYYYDFIMDPKRMRIALPQWLIKLTMMVAPQPQLILCLGAEPEVIYARKPETSLEEVTRQVETLKKMCKDNDRAVWIDTGICVKKSCDTALRAIQRTMMCK